MNTPLSPWVALVAVVAAAALLGTHQKRQWPASSGAAALTSLASLFAEFLVIGAIFDCALHKPEWLENLGLWSPIFTAFTLTVCGIGVGIPWVVAQTSDRTPSTEKR
ncbi:hypothetical protein MI149_30200 (plasmid) [Mycolicibacterium crocinum]|uniref:Uncharacterized protein n=1 Tax=Mycolicibacterium crocinum TaxID=388459 RepID=A0ABY3TTJ6_9MYCO|nr:MULTISPECIES: hypothetical protein [Mycolicibacterium]ULN44768.1 hypothetical protein MI149_30200 [Mycolicibacterium crocinum]